MKTLYVSPSSIPSRSANSIHVVNMAKAFCESSTEVTLVFRRTVKNKNLLRSEIEQTYGSLPQNLRFVSYYSKTERLTSFFIALLALLQFREKFDLIFSRNIYFALILRATSSCMFFFETHNPEKGFRKFIQRFISSSSQVRVIVISDALRNILLRSGDIEKSSLVHVLHDAAPASIKALENEEKKKLRNNLLPDLSSKKWIGYFGHLYKGRGIEIIESLSRLNPEVVFLVFGGNESSITQLKNEYQNTNLHVMGHVPHQEVLDYMRVMDVLLMPYQESVYVDNAQRMDTSKWMSPIKMFEYMASNVPIISSKIPVLEEVLYNESNCLLVNPSEATEWNSAMKRLLNDSNLSEALSKKAYSDYQNKYSWRARAQTVIRLNA